MTANPDPQGLDQAPRPLDHLAERACLMGAGERPALVLRDESFTHKALKERVATLAGWLAREVPEKGARVASWAAKGELTCVLPLAAARAGLVHVPINPLLKRAQVAHILSDCGAQLLIATPSRLKSLDEGDVPAGCLQLEEAAALEAAYDASLMLGPSQADPNELCAILYTSGSTGRPKGVMLSHANLWLGAVSVAHYLKLADDDVTLAVLPLSFDYGQNQLLSAWYAGGCVVPLDFLFPRDVSKACAKHGVTTLAAVPPLWVQLTELEWQEEASTSLRRLTNSGGALTIELVEGLTGIFPQADLYPMYGLTEAFRSTYLDPELVDAHPTSMGTAIPFAEIMVIDDDGEVAGPGEEGELVHCGPLVAQGYWQDAVRTAERFKPAPASSHYGGTAVWSGDRVKREANGLLYFVGRRDAMIKSAGNRISPQEIEEAAISTDLVVEAVALGIADDRLGHKVHLVVRGTQDQQEQSKLRRALLKELPNFMQPQEIHWREAMPLNPNGKIDRNALYRELSGKNAS
ncbi:MAG: acyl-CoA ligase (AMP-forming), exosortase A system-associated [Erythrobacter sp.]|uniref:acyl-CoA ligase (AMP-forming), exosortase A system-associated n=1 Tax=Erythrobacter sp. TaxID=1042 RepID=UPI003297D139